MRHRKIRIQRSCCARLVRAAAALLLPAITLDANTLIENSPFIPADFSSAFASKSAGGNVRKNPAVATLDFQGVYTLNGETFINIFNSKSHKGHWVRLNDSAAIFHVVRYDADTSTITLNVNDSLEDMPLRESTDNPMPINLTPASAANKTPAVRSTSANRQPVVRRRVIPPRRVAPNPR